MIDWLGGVLVLVLIVGVPLYALRMRRRLPPDFTAVAGTLRGVRGWLLLFCVWAVFVYPFLVSVTSSAGWRAAKSLAAEYPVVGTIALLDTFAVLALIPYSIYSGVRLWRVRPGAVANVKRFLPIAWAYFVLYRVAFLSAGFPPDWNRRVCVGILWSVPMFSAFVFIWSAYFTRSKRVAATFAETD